MPQYEVQNITENNKEKEKTLINLETTIAQDLTLDDILINLYEKTKFGINPHSEDNQEKMENQLVHIKISRQIQISRISPQENN